MSSKEEVAKLNPLVMPSGAIRRPFVTEANRGGTPPVFIQNPETPYFDPYNHEFPNTNANVHNQFGAQFTGGWTALHAAAQARFAGTHDNRRPVEGDLDEARFLLDGLGHHVPPAVALPHYSSPKVDVNATTTKTGLSPLHVAVKAQHRDMVQLLLNRNARVDIQDGMGRTPIHCACEAGYTSCLEPMIAVGGDHKVGFLTVTVQRASDLPQLCDVEEISFFTTVRVRRELRSVNDDKSSPVQQKTLSPEWRFIAVFQDCSPATEFVVEVHCRFVDGQETPAGQCSGLVRDFLSFSTVPAPNGTPPRSATKTSTTTAKEAPSPQPEEHATVETPEPSGDGAASLRTSVSVALHKMTATADSSGASRPKAIGSVQLALQYTPAVDLPDTTGATALMLAADGGHAECVSSLLRARADTTVREEFGTTAASRAGTAGHAAVCALIESFGGAW